MEIPSDSQQVGSGEFAYLHNGVKTKFSILTSVPHVDNREVDCAGLNPSYVVSKVKLFAYSCAVSGEIRYYIAKYGRTYRMGASDGTELIEFSIRYPVSQQGFWNPIVAHMSRSLNFGIK